MDVTDFVKELNTVINSSQQITNVASTEQSIVGNTLTKKTIKVIELMIFF